MGTALFHGIAVGFGAVGTLTKGRVGIAQPDGDAPLDLLAVLVSPDARKRLDKGGLTVIDVPHHAYVNFRSSQIEIS